MAYHPAQAVTNIKLDSGPLAEVAKIICLAAGALNNKYFTLRNGSDAPFYVWFNQATLGVDPAPGGTGIEVAFAANATAAAVATAIAAAIDNHAAFLAHADGATVQVTNAVLGAATDATAGTSGFAVSTYQQGDAGTCYPAKAVDSFSHNPSTY